MNNKDNFIKKLSKIIGGIIIVSLFISGIIVFVLFYLAPKMGFNSSKIEVYLAIFAAVMESLSIALLYYQQKDTAASQLKEANINEANFILDYNQGFIQDENMAKVESELEANTFYDKDLIITEENRQRFVNYLVYLEGLSPLILNNIMRLSSIDDLMAYRYFIAVNNKAIQEDQLFKFPEYYKGCFKLYKKWKEYRIKNNEEIIKNCDELDSWIHFYKIAGSETNVREANLLDKSSTIAELIYDTDPYIYPSAFNNKTSGINALSNAFQKENNIFSYKNIYVAINGKKIVGAAVVLNNNDYDNLATTFVDMKNSLSKNFSIVNDNYFRKHVLKDDEIEVLCLSVNENYQNKHIGRQLLSYIVSKKENRNKKVLLEVLNSNQNAIKLYETCGFKCIGEDKAFTLDNQEIFIKKMVRMPEDEQNYVLKH